MDKSEETLLSLSAGNASEKHLCPVTSSSKEDASEEASVSLSEEDASEEELVSLSKEDAWEHEVEEALVSLSDEGDALEYETEEVLLSSSKEKKEIPKEKKLGGSWDATREFYVEPLSVHKLPDN